MDVRMFAGHKTGKPLVVMQALAHQGKLVHLNEQVRRSWSNIRYLSDLHLATE